MLKKETMWAIIWTLLPAIVMYILFAVCYGWNPREWEDKEKPIFILVEICSMCAGFFGFIKIKIEEETLEKLQKISDKLKTPNE